MFIPRPDAQLHVLSFGQGPLTLLAMGGWIGSGEVWHPLFGQLAHWRCISIDHRGTGATTQHGPITVDAMVDDLLAVADQLNVGPCVLATESAGAGVALQAVQRAPGRFMGQVLVGAAWQRAVPGATDAFVASLRADYITALSGFVERCMPETRSTELRRWGLQVLSRAHVDDAVALLRCRETLPADEALPRLAVPTLLVHGGRDRIAPVQGAQELATRLARAELRLLPGLGHVPIVTAPEQVAQLIDTFGMRLLVSAGLKASG